MIYKNIEIDMNKKQMFQTSTLRVMKMIQKILIKEYPKQILMPILTIKIIFLKKKKKFPRGKTWI